MIRELPIIDFSGFDSDNKKLRNSVAKKVHEAASKVGFMYVKNIELWTELDLLSSKFEIKWNWVKAHSTDKLNNKVDLIAREAAS